MNIQTAAQYMRHGYRVRHAGWIAGNYLFMESHAYNSLEYNGFDFIKLNRIETYGGNVYHHWPQNWNPILFDLLSNDWELLLDNIIDDSKFVTYKETK